MNGAHENGLHTGSPFLLKGELSSGDLSCPFLGQDAVPGEGRFRAECKEIPSTAECAKLCRR